MNRLLRVAYLSLGLWMHQLQDISAQIVENLTNPYEYMEPTQLNKSTHRIQIDHHQSVDNLHQLIDHIKQQPSRYTKIYQSMETKYGRLRANITHDVIIQRLQRVEHSPLLSDFITLSFEDQIYLIMHPLRGLVLPTSIHYDDGKPLGFKSGASAKTLIGICREFDKVFPQYDGVFPESVTMLSSSGQKVMNTFVQTANSMIINEDAQSQEKQRLIAMMMNQYMCVDSTSHINQINQALFEDILGQYLRCCIIQRQIPMISATILPGSKLITATQIPEIIAQATRHIHINLEKVSQYYVDPMTKEMVLYIIFCTVTGLNANPTAHPILSPDEDTSCDIPGRSYPDHHQITQAYESALSFYQIEKRYGSDYMSVLTSIRDLLILIGSIKQIPQHDSLQTYQQTYADRGKIYQGQNPDKVGLLGSSYFKIQEKLTHMSIGDIFSSPRYAWRIEQMILHDHLIQRLTTLSSPPTQEDRDRFFLSCWNLFPMLLSRTQQGSHYFVAHVASQRMMSQTTASTFSKLITIIKESIQQESKKSESTDLKPMYQIPLDLSTIPQQSTQLLPSTEFPGSYFGNTEYLKLLVDIDHAFGLPKGTLACFLAIETGGKPGQKSVMGAQGLFQFMPATVPIYITKLNDLGYRIQGRKLIYQDVYHPVVSALMAEEYLREFGITKTGFDMSRAIVAYNAGPAWIGAANIPAETQVFIYKYQQLQRAIQGKFLANDSQDMQKFGLRIKSILGQLSTNTTHPNGTLSIRLLADPTTALAGDSNAQAIEAYFKKKQAGGLTKPGRRTAQLYPYLKDNLSILKKTERLVIYCGVNDVMGVLSPQAEAQKSLAQFQNIIDLVHTQYPNMQIIICEYHNVLGVRAAFIESLNQLLREAAKSQDRIGKNVRVIDPSEPLRTTDFSPHDNSVDRVHPSKATYLINKLPKE